MWDSGGGVGSVGGGGGVSSEVVLHGYVVSGLLLSGWDLLVWFSVSWVIPFLVGLV